MAEIKVAQSLSKVEGFELLAIKITNDKTTKHDPLVNMVRLIAAVKGRAQGTEVYIQIAETLLNERQEDWGPYSTPEDGTVITLQSADGLKTVTSDSSNEGGPEAVARKAAEVRLRLVFGALAVAVVEVVDSSIHPAI